ncbi:MAG: HPF/RaiA family ribosome-associated protein [Burkholderiaceae bacterium]|nr:HPF/RaiA family ribosome-associated protein [Burkholderiaceae bacterium]
MRTPLQINFRGMDTSPALETLIRDKTAKLEQFHPNVTGCRVVIDKPHQHKQQGEHFIVSIDVSVPGSNIVANHAHHEDVNVALRDAFFAARRQLEEHAVRLRGEDKRRVPTGSAMVERGSEAGAEAE